MHLCTTTSIGVARIARLSRPEKARRATPIEPHSRLVKVSIGDLLWIALGRDGREFKRDHGDHHSCGSAILEASWLPCSPPGNRRVQAGPWCYLRTLVGKVLSQLPRFRLSFGRAQCAPSAPGSPPRRDGAAGGPRRRHGSRLASRQAVPIGLMIGRLLAEARLLALDEASRERVGKVHKEKIKELSELISPDLRRSSRT